MRHLIFFYHILAFLAGITVVMLSFAAYFKLKKPVYKDYSLFIISLTLFLIDQTGTSYTLANLVMDKYSGALLGLISTVGYAMMTYYLPKFTHEFFNDELDEKKKKLFSLLALALPVSAVIIYYTLSLWLLPVLIFNVIMIGSISYSLVLARKNYARLDSKKKEIVKRFMLITYICVPYITLDLFIEKLPHVGGYFTYGILSVPTFYLLWNCLTLYFTFKLMHPLNIGNHTHETERMEVHEAEDIDAFVQKYGITAREKEVIDLLKKGFSYSRICEELVISMPTVKSHVYNIYQKTGVKNKVELINKINSTGKDKK